MHDVRVVPTVSGGHFMGCLPVRPRCPETRCAPLYAVGWETNKNTPWCIPSVRSEVDGSNPVLVVRLTDPTVCA